MYARVSTKDKGQDTENQLGELREFAKLQGWTIVGECVDRATGRNSDREQFKKLFEDASCRRFDSVLFSSLNRFSREGVLETLRHLERLAAAGVGYRSITEQYLDSCGMFKDAVLAILAVIAKQERVRLCERTVAGLEKAKRAGRIGRRPRAIADKTKIFILKSNGLSTREIGFKLGLSAATVCRILNAPLEA